MAVYAIVVLTFIVCEVPEALGQSDQPAAVSAPAARDAGIVTGHPFSATSYVHTVRNLPNGKQQLIRYERFPFQLARDRDGRVRFENAGKIVDCDQPTLSDHPACPLWEAIVFDPSARTISRWGEGERDAHQSVTVWLSAQQVESAENSTTAMPENVPEPDTDAMSVTTEDLGEKTVEGLRATGVRTTTMYPAGHSGNKTPIAIIHDVWTSQEMRLVVKIVDGDPHGEETISDLEQVSLQPDLSSFDLLLDM
jgi:hypothetical protein